MGPAMPDSDSLVDIQKSKVKLFEKQFVRAVWDETAEKWWFSVVDIVAVLTDSDYQRARKYWKVMKGRLSAEGNETVTNCYQLKLLAPDGKMRLTDIADTEQIQRFQSFNNQLGSKKARKLPLKEQMLPNPPGLRLKNAQGNLPLVGLMQRT